MIVQYLREYITAVEGDEQKIAAFEERYGYTPKPFLRDGINDSRYYHLSNNYPNEATRYAAAVRLFSVVVHEPKIAPPRGKQREVVRQWLLWLSGRQDYDDVEQLVDLCRREIGIGSAETINSIINQTSELTAWRNSRLVATSSQGNVAAVKNADEVETADTVAATKVTDLELLENFKNSESYRAADAKDKRAMKKAFAKMTYEERILYFALE